MIVFTEFIALIAYLSALALAVYDSLETFDNVDSRLALGYIIMTC